MSSIIEGYSYDIFISYRQKDNKGDKWVSEFVENLQTELESTFKEEIRVYFDINPHDGLLVTHDVDASLKEKLKCLVFIPIISRTYCDPKSFAWEHEFKTFVDQASKDKYGLRIMLPNGNVANRVLPVRIHDLDVRDNLECESVLSGSLRGVEFIYKTTGVNRPLRSKEDSPNSNLNKTFYRDQLNVVALAIKEIISGLKKEAITLWIESKEFTATSEKPVTQEKSIIVLPFENISSDPNQEYFSDGLTEEIISDLSHIEDLLVISRSSAMTFKGANKTIREISNKMNVRYVLEGSVRKSGNNIRVNAQLIDGTNDSHLLAEKYNGTLEDIFDIQEKVSQSIVKALKIKLTSQAIKKIHERPIENVSAYDCYKRAYPELMSFSKDRIEHGLNILYKGLDIAGENALIYAGIAFAHFQYVNAGVEQNENIKKAEHFAEKALNLNNELAEAHFVMGAISSISGKPKKAIYHGILAHEGKPEDPEIMMWIALGYSLLGRIDAGKSIIKKCVKIDPINPMNDSIIGWNHFYNGRFDLAFDPLCSAYDLNPESGINQFWKSIVLFYNNRSDEAYQFISKYVEEPAKDTWIQLTIFLKYTIKQEKNKLVSLMNPNFIKTHKLDPQNSYIIAALFSFIGETEKSYEWLENAIDRGFVNYPFLNEYDPFLSNIRNEGRFKKLMKKVKNLWESYDVFFNNNMKKSDRSIISEKREHIQPK